MRRSFGIVALAAAALVAAGLAVAQTGPATNRDSPPARQTTSQGRAMPNDTGGSKQPPPTASTDAFKAAADHTHIDMAIPYTGEADHDFAAVMGAHDKGAIAMARVELEFGKDADLRAFAQEVIAARDREIAFTQAWLAKHR